MQPEKIELNGKILIARELTVREEEKVLEDLKDHELHIVESMFPEEFVSALMLATSLDIEVDSLCDLTRSQLAVVIEEVKKKNRPLVEAVERIAERWRRIMAEESEETRGDLLPPSTDSAATVAD